MPRAASPIVRRRELAGRLRSMRQSVGLSIEDVATHLMVSAAKVSRMETGARGVSARDVRDLCNLYGVPDDERERLLTLLRESKQPSWWQQYDLGDYTTYVGLEAAATSIVDYESSLVPGLLQTEDYARAVVEGILYDVPPDQIRQRVETRMLRQQLLTGDNPPSLWAIVDEAALHRSVGGPDVMRAQLEVLADRAALPNVTLQVIPLEVGAHPGMDSTFILLSLEDVSDVCYIEGLVGNLYLESPADLARYRRAVDHLRAVALSPRDSIARVSRLTKIHVG